MTKICGIFLLLLATSFAFAEEVSTSEIESLVSQLVDIDPSVRSSAEAALVRIGQPAVEFLIKAVRSRDPIVRRHAGYALAQMHNPAAIKSLVETMTGADKKEARRAAKFMARVGCEEAIPVLIDMLQDTSTTFQKRGKSGLIAIGEPAVEPLLKLLHHKNARIRISAMGALSAIGDKRAVEPLIEILKNDTEAGTHAATALGQIGDTEVVSLLIGMLKDKDPLMRQRAALALGNIGDQRAIGPLLELFKDEDQSVPIYAVQALVKLGEAVYDKVIEVLGDENKMVRKYAVMTLGQLKDSRAIEPLRSVIKNETEDNEVRAAAITALGSVEGTAVIADLITFLQYDAPLLSKAASQELIKIGEPAIKPLITLLNTQNAVVLKNVKEALTTIGKSAVPYLIAALDNDKFRVRKNTIDILAVIGDESVVPHLIKKLADPSESVQIAAAVALGRIGDERAVSPILKLARSKSEPLKLEAIKSISLIGKKAGDKATEALIKVARTESSEVQREAIVALGKIGNPEAMPVLLELLETEKASIKMAVIVALGEIGDERAVEPLVKLLKHVHPDVRRLSVIALGNIGSVVAVNSLLDCLQDLAKNVRLATIQVLSSRAEVLVPEAIIPLIEALEEPDTYQQRLVTNILVRIGEDAIDPLIERLDNDNPDIRKYAARALGSIRNPKALEPLLAALNDEDPDVRAAAAAGLGEIGDSKAVEPLIKRLTKEEKKVKLAAAWALGNIGDARAVMPLNVALNDENPQVREAAGAALGKMTGQSCPLVTNLTRFDFVSFIWAALLGILLFFPFVGRKIKPIDRFFRLTASKYGFPAKAKWWIMLILGLGALALFVWCYVCRDDQGAAVFALLKPGFLPTLYLYSFRIFPFFIGGCVLSGFIIRYFSGRRHLPRSTLGATTLGAVTPLCSCAVIPMARGMLATQIPVRAAMAFLVATPILSPFIIIMSYGIIGLKFALVRIISVFVLAIVAGIFIERVVGREEVEQDADFQKLCQGCAKAGAVHGPADSVLITAWNQVGYLLKYMVLGTFLGALLENYLPISIVIKYMSSNFLGLLAATTIGLPLYLCSGQEVLFLKPLMDMGLPMGHAIAFTIATNGICLTSIALLAGAIGRKTTLWLTILFWSGALVIGFFINILL